MTASLFTYMVKMSIDSHEYLSGPFFLTPEGEEFYYDKRHLFRMGREAEHFSAGNRLPNTENVMKRWNS